MPKKNDDQKKKQTITDKNNFTKSKTTQLFKYLEHKNLYKARLTTSVCPV